MSKSAMHVQEDLQVVRHSTAHLLAQALKRLYGADAVKLGVGQAIENGFYYDVEADFTISIDALDKIEQEMRRIVEEDLPVEHEVLSRDAALALFRELEEPYKLEMVEAMPSDAVATLVRQGEFVDLCDVGTDAGSHPAGGNAESAEPHVPSTGALKSFKLVSVAGAYWRGDAKNAMLQRIYGVAFHSDAELQEYLHQVEEAKKRDHRKLGKELELFMFSDDAPGMPFFLPNGFVVRSELESFERNLQRADYQEVRTPFLMNQRLWEQSGHWDHFHENMYFSEVDGTTYALKPMNCPGHMLLYKNKMHSYRDLPVRLSEYGQCHRNELSGALNGMMRVRNFTQDDAHIFCRPDQIESEIQGILKLIDQIYGVFGFPYRVELSTRPDKSMGEDHLWEGAELALRNVLVAAGVEFRLNEGDGAFYGPKIDFHIQDALHRSWQCATIQLDFQLPERFDLTYIGEDNQKHRPVVIHRAVFGSVDRFVGILTEHFAGAFPIWLAPVQVRLIPVASEHTGYAESLRRELVDQGLRVDLDVRNEKLGYRIREASKKKVPFTIVIGDKEVESGEFPVRQLGLGDLGTHSKNAFVAYAESCIRDRR